MTGAVNMEKSMSSIVTHVRKHYALFASWEVINNQNKLAIKQLRFIKLTQVL